MFWVLWWFVRVCMRNTTHLFGAVLQQRICVFICVAWPTRHVWHDSFVTCDMTYSYVWHNSFIRCCVARAALRHCATTAFDTIPNLRFNYIYTYICIYVYVYVYTYEYTHTHCATTAFNTILDLRFIYIYSMQCVPVCVV